MAIGGAAPPPPAVRRHHRAATVQGGCYYSDDGKSDESYYLLYVSRSSRSRPQYCSPQSTCKARWRNVQLQHYMTRVRGWFTWHEVEMRMVNLIWGRPNIKVWLTWHEVEYQSTVHLPLSPRCVPRAETSPSFHTVAFVALGIMHETESHTFNILNAFILSHFFQA